jgi:excisionase family DNA binding protein
MELTKQAQLADTLRRAISDGTLRPGDPVPVGALMAEYGVCRNTAGAAVRALLAEGLLVRWQGSSYIVKGTRPDPGPGPPGPATWGFAGDTRQWVLCVNALAAWLHDGTYPDGHWMPAIKDVAITMKTSASAVFDAYARLAEKGLITKTGRGAYYAGCGPRPREDPPIARRPDRHRQPPRDPPPLPPVLEERYLTVSELSAIVRVEQKTVYKLVAARKFDGVIRFAGRIRIPASSVEKYLKSLPDRTTLGGHARTRVRNPRGPMPAWATVGNGRRRMRTRWQNASLSCSERGRLSAHLGDHAVVDRLRLRAADPELLDELPLAVRIAHPGGRAHPGERGAQFGAHALRVFVVVVLLVLVAVTGLVLILLAVVRGLAGAA